MCLHWRVRTVMIEFDGLLAPFTSCMSTLVCYYLANLPLIVTAIHQGTSEPDFKGNER